MQSSADKDLEKEKVDDKPVPRGPALETVEAWSDIPEFKGRKEESEFWSRHGLDPRLMNASIHKPNVRESTTITLRFDPRMLARIKRIARMRYLNYQSMIKQWLSERLEDEM